MTDDKLRRLARWWRQCQGDESFRTALNFCAGQLELALDGELPGFDTTTVYQGGSVPDWLNRSGEQSMDEVWGITRFDPAIRTGIVVIELFASKELAEVFRDQAAQRYTVTRFHVWDVLPSADNDGKETWGSPVSDHPLGFLL